MSATQPLREEYQMQFPVTLVLPVREPIDDAVAHMLYALATNPVWHERKIAAQKLAEVGGEEARRGLLEALPSDPFWMVRCAIIQALERIGDAGSVPVLQVAAEFDQNEIVQQYAAVAIERLSTAE